MNATNILLIIGIALILIGTIYTFISGTWLKVEGQNATNTTLNQMCFQMYHLDNWTLGYLRALSAYCSNGGQ